MYIYSIYLLYTYTIHILYPPAPGPLGVRGIPFFHWTIIPLFPSTLPSSLWF